MSLDWTKVLGSAILLAGAIAGSYFKALPLELCYTLAAVVPAMWVLPAVAKVLGVKY